MKLWWLRTTFRTCFCTLITTFFTLLLQKLNSGCGHSWHCSINMNIVARSLWFLFMLPLLKLHLCSVNRKFSFPRCSRVHCDSLNSSTCVVRPSWRTPYSRACPNIVRGTPGFEHFGFLIHVAHFRNAEIVIWCDLFILLVCRNS